MLAGPAPVVVDERVDLRAVGGGARPGQRDGAFGRGPGSSFRPVDLDRRPRVAAEVLGLDEPLTRGDQDLATIDIEIAETDSSRERGLMQRTSLPDQSGMFFIFDREEPQEFWMANTPLSLDIFFVNADSQIVNIARYTKPYSSEHGPSIDPAMYVVETEAGFADTYGITESDQVRWTRAE